MTAGSSDSTGQLQDLVRLIRPHHWLKNLIVLLPVVFGMRYGDFGSWAAAVVLTSAFCLVSSGVYVFNDIVDHVSDLKHPQKRQRPIASGRVTVGRAWWLSVALVVAALAVGLLADLLIVPALLSGGAIRPYGTLGIFAYATLQAVYSLWLKNKMLLDVICIALGFVVRAAAGAAIIRVAISPWLVVCTFTVCLFMGFCKRRTEAHMLNETDSATAHRKTLAGYTPELLGHLISVSAGIAVVSYLIYAMSPRTVAVFGTNYFVYTLPVVTYAVFRFAMQSILGRYSDPTELILRDKGFQISVLLWVVMAGVIVVWGRELSTWLGQRY